VKLHRLIFLSFGFLNAFSDAESDSDRIGSYILGKSLLAVLRRLEFIWTMLRFGTSGNCELSISFYS
jgi:hypothetical protein